MRFPDKLIIHEKSNFSLREHYTKIQEFSALMRKPWYILASKGFCEAFSYTGIIRLFCSNGEKSRFLGRLLVTTRLRAKIWWNQPFSFGSVAGRTFNLVKADPTNNSLNGRYEGNEGKMCMEKVEQIKLKWPKFLTKNR